MKVYFQELFHYNHDINARVCEVLRSQAEFPPDCLKEMGHIIAAQNIWLKRLKGEGSAVLDLWPKPDVEVCSQDLQKSGSEWTGYINSLSEEDFEKPFRYRDMKGQEWDSLVRQTLTHVINHSTHHRAKIAVYLRTAGITPPILDFTYWSRRAPVSS